MRAEGIRRDCSRRRWQRTSRSAGAAEHGARVLLLEKQPFLGGTTGIAIGSFTANSTALQRSAGIQDHPDDHEEDASRFAPAEIESHCNRACEGSSWASPLELWTG